MNSNVCKDCVVAPYGIALPFVARPKLDARRSVHQMTRHSIPSERLQFSRIRNIINRTVPLPAVTSSSELETSTELGEANVLEVAPNIFQIKCSCLERLKFEVEYGLKRGTSENSFLIQGPDRASTVLIDVPVEYFQIPFLLTLQKAIIAKKIGKIVLSHLDPKAIPVLKELVSLINYDGKNSVDVYASSAALRLLEENWKEDDEILQKCKLQRAARGAILELGTSGTSLEFIRIATPRWPDMLAIFIPQRRILFSSKLFSCHVAPQLTEVKMTPFDVGGWETYGNDWKYYFDTMLAPAPNQISKALDDLSFTTTAPSFWAQLVNWLSPKQDEEESKPTRQVAGICPMHGPVVKNSMTELVSGYVDWIEELKSATGTVAVFYASAYGNTAALAQAISHGVTKSSVGITTVNLEAAEPSEVQQAISKADGFVIGSPTLGGHMPTQVQSALGTILRDTKAKELPCGVFGSFGWSGEAVDEMTQRLRDGGFSFAFDPIKVKFKPTGKDLQMCEESGTDLAQSILKKFRKTERSSREVTQARTASGAAQAIGRLIGTLCIVSGKDDDAESGMLASWISQASFDPPGLTIAVKRDRALENVLMTENRFVVNILSEGNEKGLVKHMLKPFKPGEDRFEGLACTVSSETDCVVLDDSVSFLECTVKERMEAGDHWIVYATVDGGSVLDSGSVSAVHHRTVGTNY